MRHPDQDHGPLRVDVIGTDRRMLEGLQAAFAGRGHSRYLIVNATIAEVLIVDLSNSQSELLWKDYQREYPGRPTVVLSTEPVDVPEGCILQLKPLDLGRLFDSLETFRDRAGGGKDYRAAEPSTHGIPEATAQSLQLGSPSSQHASRQGASYHSRLDELPTVDLDEPPPEAVNFVGRQGEGGEPTDPTTILEEVRHLDGLSSIDLMGDRPDLGVVELESAIDLYLNTANTLLAGFQAALKAAVNSGSPTGMDFQGHTLIIAPDEELVYHRSGARPFYQICQQPLGTNRVQLSVAAKPSRDDTSWRVESVTSKLWKMALWTYQGRLPAQTDINYRMYLAHWPNFTRLLPLPNALRIAALWTEQPMPMSFTADALRIPQRNVFAFYSAAYTIGLSGHARRDADYLFQPGALSC